MVYPKNFCNCSALRKSPEDTPRVEDRYREGTCKSPVHAMFSWENQKTWVEGAPKSMRYSPNKMTSDVDTSHEFVGVHGYAKLASVRLVAVTPCRMWNLLNAVKPATQTAVKLLRFTDCWLRNAVNHDAKANGTSWTLQPMNGCLKTAWAPKWRSELRRDSGGCWTGSSKITEWKHM